MRCRFRGSFMEKTARKLFLLLLFVFCSAEPSRAAQVLGERAVRLMEECIAVLREARVSLDLPIDLEADPHARAVVGEEFTPLTTSLGHVEDKRTAADPRFAGAVVGYFENVGLHSGDVVAIGASGSFPGYILATLCAAETMELRPLIVYSYGASMYGATLPAFTFPVMLSHLQKAGLLTHSRILAVSMGGRGDQAQEVLLHENPQQFIRDLALSSGYPFIDEPDFVKNVARRMAVFEEGAAGRPIGVFVNTGGAGINYGYLEESLKLPPGLIVSVDRIPDNPRKGLIFEYLSRGVPVVHLLFTKGLCEANGIPYDE